MIANQGLRLVCADILDGLARANMWRWFNGDLRSMRLLNGADMLRWTERFVYGEPVPGDVHEAALIELEYERDDLGQLADDYMRSNERLRKRVVELEKRITSTKRRIDVDVSEVPK